MVPERRRRREPQNSSIPEPRFQRGGILNHASGRVPRLMEFQSWKVNFKTEVCSKTADPHLTMHWVKEVEIAKSIVEFVTSRSNLGRTDSPDYDMLDAMIASALTRLLNTHVAHPKKSKCRRGTRLKNTTDSHEGDKLLT